jgi:Protein of unknown function (DUF1614)
MKERISEIANWLKTAVPPFDFGLVPGSFFAPGGAAAPWLAVVLPLVVSLALLYQARHRLREYSKLIALWFVSIPVMYFTSYWREVEGVLCLQIVVIFSIGALCMTWRRMPVAPGIAYALTFFSLVLIDLIRATEFALERGHPLPEFLHGIGGAGLFDGLFVFPLLTAVTIMYAHWRQRSQPERALVVALHRSGFVASR